MSQELEQELEELMLQAQEIDDTQLSNASYTNLGHDDKIREWVGKALALARNVRADTVSITAGFPAGLCVTVTFASPGERSDDS